MIKKLYFLSLTTFFWSLTSLSGAFAAIIRGEVSRFDLVAEPFIIDLGMGPISTGPITISKIDSSPSSVVFNVDDKTGEGIGSLDVLLQIDIPALGISKI